MDLAEGWCVCLGRASGAGAQTPSGIQGEELVIVASGLSLWVDQPQARAPCVILPRIQRSARESIWSAGGTLMNNPPKPSTLGDR